jgi:hypothetical protein
MDLAVETLEPAAQFSFWHAMLREDSRRRVPRGVDKGWKSSSKSPFASSGRDGATLGASFFRDRGLETNALEKLIHFHAFLEERAVCPFKRRQAPLVI